MKHFFRFIRNSIFSILAFVLVVLLLAGGYFGVKGYNMYKKAIEEKPISERISAIQEQDYFIKYDDLPSIYIDAVISAEDKRFESHFGIDPVSICRAVWTDLRSLSLAEGGSTITQQIAKNLLFTQEKRIERKAAEVFAAFALEEEYSKEELFEIYVNTIYFGNGYYGIHDAAEGYFGKLPSDLTDYEAVMLAGLPNAPSAYSLNANPDLALKRMKVVLRRMVKCGKLSEEKADIILKEGNVSNLPSFPRCICYKLVYPIRDSSTSLAASLPSATAHTTRDCPLCMSPAVKTRSTFVWCEPEGVSTFVRESRFTPKLSAA